MTLQQFVDKVLLDGGSMNYTIVYNDMNFSGKSTDTDFGNDSFVTEIKDMEVRINSEYWTPID